MFRPSLAGLITDMEGFTVEAAFTLDCNRGITVLVGQRRKGILSEDRIVFSNLRERGVLYLHCIGDIESGHQEMEART